MKSFAAFLAISTFAVAAAAADAAAAPDAKKGAELYTATCVACHGPDGNSSVPTQPSLAQQHPEYLVKQLVEFKSGAREDPIMKGFASALSEQDAADIAAWLETQPLKRGFAKDESLVELGQRIWRGGLADRHIPACAACHGPRGSGIPAEYPRLGGQFAEYTAKQISGFRDGSRANSEVMHGVSAYLTDHEIKAVSDYIAGLR